MWVRNAVDWRNFLIVVTVDSWAANKYDLNYFARKADKHLKYLGAIKQTRTFPTSLITYSLKSACSTVFKQKTNARP